MRCAYALRRSVYIAFADEAFAKWLDQPVEAQELNRDAEIISDALRTWSRKANFRSDRAGI